MPLTEQQLRALLAHPSARTVRHEQVTLPRVDINRGLVATSDFADVRVRGPAGGSVRISPRLADVLQFRFSWFGSDGTLEVLDLKNRSLHVHPLSGRVEVGVATFAPNVAYARPTQSGDRFVVAADRVALVIQREGDVLELSQYDLEPDRDAAGSRFAPPEDELDLWSDSCEDGVLRQRASQLARRQGEWSAFAAAALLSFVPGYRRTAPVHTAADLMGLPLVEGRPVEWIRTLSPSTLERVEAECVHRARALERELARLNESYAPYSDAWRRRLQTNAWARACLEAAGWLLGQAKGESAVLSAALSAADAAGMEILPPEDAPFRLDPVLHAAAGGVSEAWWDLGA